jgi:hypothetical protein
MKAIKRAALALCLGTMAAFPVAAARMRLSHSESSS